MTIDQNLESQNRANSSSHPWYGGLEFRTLAESIPALVFVGDSDGTNIYTNMQFQRYTGMEAEELIGDGWLNTIHLDDRERAAATWLESWTKGSQYDTKYRFRRFDGEYRWHLVRGAPVRDANDNIIRWIGSCTDVEDLIGTIAMHTQAEQILSALGTASDIIVHAKDAEGRFIFANQAVIDAVSQKRQFFFGQTANDLAIEDSESKDMEQSDLRVRMSKEPETVDESWTLPGTQTRYLRSTKVPLPLPDGTTGTATLSIDVTDSNELSDKYAQTLVHSRNRVDSLPIITWVADDQGKLVEANQAWFDHVGFNQALGIDFKDLVATDSMDDFFNHWQFCLDSGELMDIPVTLKDEITGTQVSRRALAIPMDRSISGASKRYWYGSFS